MPALLIGGLVVFLGWLGLGPYKRIAVSTTEITVRKGGTAPLIAALVYKGWFSLSFKLVPGTITFLHGNIVTVSPSPATTSATQPDAMETVTGVATGTGTITINGRSAEGKHDAERIKVTVVAGE